MRNDVVVTPCLYGFTDLGARYTPGYFYAMRTVRSNLGYLKLNANMSCKMKGNDPHNLRVPIKKNLFFNSAG